ncbi:hypothetical protein ABTW72_25530 [Micromonospora sp. NPDC127501]|uniref:hypothetical protein n=1 Tax=Micromonospora sp. NPDC127501 TaxID=3154872 RepID=UPI003321FBD3
MGLFSSTTPLTSKYADALSPYFEPDEVGKRAYRTGCEKLAAGQGAIDASLRSGEDLLTIVPGFLNGGFERLAVLTSQRVMEFKRKLEREIAVSEVAEVERMVHVSGTFMVLIISKKALPYAPMRNSNSAAGMKFHENSLLLYMSTPDLAQHFASLLDGARGR